MNQSGFTGIRFLFGEVVFDDTDDWVEPEPHHLVQLPMEERRPIVSSGLTKVTHHTISAPFANVERFLCYWA
jgi:arylamine N-acetyltransferase